MTEELITTRSPPEEGGQTAMIMKPLIEAALPAGGTDLRARCFETRKSLAGELTQRQTFAA